MSKEILFLFFLFWAQSLTAQLLSWTPEFITENAGKTSIVVDAAMGNQGLLGHNPNDVYTHIGVITNKSTNQGDWRYVYSVWGNTDPDFKAVPVSDNHWKFEINEDLRLFFKITDPDEKILKIAILFRSGDGNKKQANKDGSDMFIPVYEEGLRIRITEPLSQPTFFPEPEEGTITVGQPVTISVLSSETAQIQILINGQPIKTGSSVSISTDYLPDLAGDVRIIAAASKNGQNVWDTLDLNAVAKNQIAPLPEGMEQGINYTGNSGVTLVLFAPDKSRVEVLGDFPGTGWTSSGALPMNQTPDGNYWWTTITGLNPETEYSFQYLVDGQLRIADPYIQKILDPDNDPFISSQTYPGLKSYPVGQTSGIVGTLKINDDTYQWGNHSFQRPEKTELVIYELLVRDFVADHDWKTMIDTLNYLKTLGINAIEIMPFSEFEGNISWGYNPDFYFAPDKYYGTENKLKEFIDSCHSNGIAVIMDMVLNHSFGSSPMVRMYWDNAANRPSADNPWFNPAPKHAFNVGFDMNHESPATKYFVSRVLKFWSQEYKIDGFRFDLSKGFTQKQTCDDNGNNCNVNLWSQYDQSRIDIWTGYYDTLRKYNQNAYCILEHFADNSEEKVLSDYGMMLWGNMNYNYNQASMGYDTDWDFSGALAAKRGWSKEHLVSYMESHDEERLMYKNLRYGNASNGYDIKDLKTALGRQQLVAAFFFTLPGPKMIWQFGELGYAYSINHCGDDSENEACRTDPKPIRWDYFQDPDRKALFDVYKKLIELRKTSTYRNLVTGGSFQYDFSSSVKWLKISSGEDKMVVMGNFDVVPHTGIMDMVESGKWVDYLTGDTLEMGTSNPSFSFDPGEFRILFFAEATEPSIPDFNQILEGKNEGTSNLLSWIAPSTGVVVSYEVQRSDHNMNFVKIGEVPATGAGDYQFRDEEVVNGINTYRIKITDANGKVGYSNEVAVERRGEDQPGSEFSIGIAPNPFAGVLVLDINTPSGEKVKIWVVDVNGKKVLRDEINLQPGRNKIELEKTRTLQKGLYFINIFREKQKISLKGIKQ